jgi:chorismate-pyruvate lyase
MRAMKRRIPSIGRMLAEMDADPAVDALRRRGEAATTECEFRAARGAWTAAVLSAASRAAGGPGGASLAGSEPVSAAAALAALNAALMRDTSATSALERWCRASGAPDAGGWVVAQVLARADASPTADLRRRLGVSPAELVRYRRVRLRCGARVLSEAENWYVPGRLTPGMNRLLEQTDAPFGRVVQELRYLRRLLAVEPLWAAPTEPSREAAGVSPPPHVLRHHALLVSADGAPFSEVVETYTREALFLPEPQQ